VENSGQDAGQLHGLVNVARVAESAQRVVVLRWGRPEQVHGGDQLPDDAVPVRPDFDGRPPEIPSAAAPVAVVVDGQPVALRKTTAPGPVLPDLNIVPLQLDGRRPVGVGMDFVCVDTTGPPDRAWKTAAAIAGE
jgi:hypothetical protein